MTNLTVTLESDEKTYDLEEFGLSYESNPEDILTTMQPVILESFGANIKNEGGEWLYTVHKVESSKNIYLYPKSVAGQ